jgi:multidrug efflux system outer membrane protein
MRITGMPGPRSRTIRHTLAALLSLLASACTLGPDYSVPTAAELHIPPAWHATLPHDGSVVDLDNWWAQFDDPVLSSLISEAQVDNPTIDAAVARLRQARALMMSSRAALLPVLNGSTSFNRSNSNTTAVTSSDVNSQMSLQSGELNVAAGALDASWELDLFGKLRREHQADAARAEASVANWHDARVSVAADVADAYVRLRGCQALLEVADANRHAREKSQQITLLKVRAGFAAPVESALSDASLAQSNDILELQRSQCERHANEIVALSGLSRSDLDTRLTVGYASIPVARVGAVQSIPAKAIEQRPDVRERERTLAGASAEIGAAIAARLPSVSLAGSIGINQYRASGQSLQLRPWSFGPSLTLPVFDGGSGEASVEGARGRYDEALSQYKAKVRQAVREVEDALARIAVSQRRVQTAALAEQRYRRYFESVERQYQAGSIDVLDLETARSQLITGEQANSAAHLERAQAWIALYRAVGGGWRQTPATPALAAGSSTHSCTAASVLQ